MNYGNAETYHEMSNDLTIIVEGLAQGATDAYEEKGVAYCGGYAVGTVLASKGIDKIGQAGKDVVGSACEAKYTENVVKVADEVDDVAGAVSEVTIAEDTGKVANKVEDVAGRIESGSKTIEGVGKHGTFADMMEPAEAARYQEYWGWKYAESSPIEIPSNATMKIQFKTGYEQIQYKWSDGSYKYDVRWHTRTPGAPAEQGNTWVIERTTPGNANGQNKVKHILTGECEWTTRREWQEAITARQNGMATDSQNALLKGGHWPAP